MTITLLEKIGTRQNSKGRWEGWGKFQCSYCGTAIERPLSKGQRNQSCGCMKNTLISTSKIKHSDAIKIKGVPTRLYSIWRNMLNRCQKPVVSCFKYYGARGIKVCSEWEDYATFKTWALSSGYQDSLTLDRLDNDKGYSPENCQWACRERQANNKRNNTILEYMGEKHSIADWARLTGINPKTISNRLRQGWNVEKTLTAGGVHARTRHI